MNVGIIGLGKMGYAIAQRASKGGHTVYGFDLIYDEFIREHAQKDNIHLVSTLEEIAQHTSIIWLMIPAGVPVAKSISRLQPLLKPYAIIIDGGNSFYKDSIQHAENLKKHDIYFLDCGTSGGIHGIEDGFCLMVGGDETAYKTMMPLFASIAAPHGVAHIGKSGTGHYVKMVHNGIEYGLLQAYAEGFHLLKDGSFKDSLDLLQIAQLWNTSSVIRSFLLELTINIFKQDQQLYNVKGIIAQGGTGIWTVKEAHEHTIPTDIIERSVEIRKESHNQPDNYANKIVALLREQFGGHNVNRTL